MQHNIISYILVGEGCLQLDKVDDLKSRVREIDLMESMKIVSLCRGAHLYIVFVQTKSGSILIGPDRLTTSKLTGCRCHRLSGLRIPHHSLTMPEPSDILIAYF